MNSWLLISDFAFYLKVLRTGFISFENEKSLEPVEYVIASSPESVFEGAEDHRCELIFTDVRYKKTNGIGLLRELRRLNAKARIVVVTHDLDAELEQNALEAGADLCFSKPKNRQEFKTLFMLLRALVVTGSQALPAGDLYGVSLVDLMRFFNLKRASYLCEVGAGANVGRIFVNDGMVTHVQCGELGGCEAFQKLLRLEGGGIELFPLSSTTEGTVEVSTAELLQSSRALLSGRRESDTVSSDLSSTRRLKEILTAIDAEATRIVKVGCGNMLPPLA